MPGAAAAAGLAVCAATLTLGLAVVGGASAAAQHAAGAADAAALAAADAAAGALDGDPCAVAGAVADANGAALIACDLDGLVATVRAAYPYAGLRAEASARAGPPP
ncbi:MAG TPA: helicase [Microbacterium sp.]|nr:helicase [Microbacterium sp.]